jgi:Ran GTPase-activating protein (RanGAP) involved in mRNA processing and transport
MEPTKVVDAAMRLTIKAWAELPADEKDVWKADAKAAKEAYNLLYYGTKEPESAWHLSAEGLDTLAKLRSGTLEELDLCGFYLGAEGGLALAGAMENNTTLKYLFLCHTSLGPEGVVALAGMLRSNTGLEKLHLTNTNPGMAGTVAIAEALKQNTTCDGFAFDGNGRESRKYMRSYYVSAFARRLREKQVRSDEEEEDEDEDKDKDDDEEEDEEEPAAKRVRVSEDSDSEGSLRNGCC